VKIFISNLAARTGGGITYLLNLIESLSKVDSSNKIIAFINKEMESYLRSNATHNIRIHAPRFSPNNIIARIIWEQLWVPFLLKRGNADVLLCPGNYISFLTKVPTVMVIQNVGIVGRKTGNADEGINIKRGLLRIATFLSMKRANKVVFPSISARDIILPISGVNIDKAEVIYHGLDNAFIEEARSVEGDAKAFLQGDIRYILSVSNIMKHKNFENIIKAFRYIYNDYRGGMKLLLAGAASDRDYYFHLQNVVKQLELCDAVMFLGLVPKEQLPELYARAEAFICASHYESFCFPVIEAMACGTPLALSDIEVFREIAGMSAVYFDEKAPEDIYRKLKLILEDDNLKKKMGEEAKIQIKRYRWENTAARLFTIFEEIGGTKRTANGHI
jgi:glycosyltransferase involved in cell wall biosynthesis